MVKIILFLLPILLYGGSDLYQEGKNIYFSNGCSGCHGVSATGTNAYPSLAYRRKALLINKLKDFRAKKGNTQQSQLMIPFAAELTDHQINAVVTFLSDYHENKSTYKSDFTIRGDGGS